MSTVGQPDVMAPPWFIVSPRRAAGILQTMTVALPLATLEGGPTQIPMVPTCAAGSLPIRTVIATGGTRTPPTCGTGPVTMGQTCISDNLAAGSPIKQFF